ncbi:suppressor of glycerol defect [Haplosporangium bisporale]|nr:suppressor of glycerol defect [Haplosporangium bisporale]
MAFNRGGSRGGRGGNRGRARYGIAPGGRIKTSTTNLPAALSEEMESSSSQFFAEGDDRNFNKKFKNKAAGRKVRRKQERLEKKRHRAPTLSKVELLARQQHTMPSNEPSDSNSKGNKKSNKKQRIEIDLNEDDGEEREEEKFLRESKKKAGKASSAMKDTKDLDARRLEKLAKSNPAFYAMLQEDGVVAGGGPALEEGMDEDEQYIRHYEKKLGIKRKDASKLSNKKSFLDDGLGDLLEGIELGSRGRAGVAAKKSTAAAPAINETPGSSAPQDKKRKASQVESDDEDEGEDASGEDSFDEELEGVDPEDMENSEEDMEDFEEMEGSDGDGMESFDEELEGLGSDDESNEAEDDDEDMEDMMDMEDMASESGSDEVSADSDHDADDHDAESDEQEVKAPVPAPAQAGKYLPPHLRAAAAAAVATESGASALAKAIPRQNTEELQRLRRQLQGLLNKLSESNIESILMDIEALYRKYPRADVTETITDMILASISSKANLLDSFVILYATVVASLYRLVGIEFAAHFIQTLVEQFDGHHALASSTKSTEMTDETLSAVKQCTNLIVLVSELYNMQVIACVLVYELIRWFMTELSEMNVELVVKIVKTSGYQLRQDDPTTLKTIIQEFTVLANQASTKIGASGATAAPISSRTRFLLETLTALKANRMKGPSSNSTTSGTITESTTRMKKFLSGLSKKRTTFPSEPMRVGLTDIRQVGTKGKWWLVGSSWKNNMVGEENTRTSLSTSTADDMIEAEDELLKLARKNKMNTDVRRSIFVVLMSSEDYIDAFERLIKLNLKEVQQREIVRVLLHCAGNPQIHSPLQPQNQKKETPKDKPKLNAQALADIFIRAAVNPTLAQGIIFFLQAFVKKGQVCQTEREKETVKWGCTTVREVLQGAVNTGGRF